MPVKPKMTAVEFAKECKRRRDQDSELVVGVFKNLETKGGTARFSYRVHKDDENEIYELVDGERYRLKRGVARHLNNQCYYKEYQHMKGEYGETGVRAGFNDGRLHSQDKMQVSKKIHRFAFHSLEYMDDDLDMYPSNIVEVTSTL